MMDLTGKKFGKLRTFSSTHFESPSNSGFVV